MDEIVLNTQKVNYLLLLGNVSTTTATSNQRLPSEKSNSSTVILMTRSMPPLRPLPPKPPHRTETTIPPNRRRRSSPRRRERCSPSPARPASFSRHGNTAPRPKSFPGSRPRPRRTHTSASPWSIRPTTTGSTGANCESSALPPTTSVASVNRRSY